MKAVTFTFAQLMTGYLLDYRLRQSQMVRVVLPNANMTYITHSYTAFSSLFNEEY